MIKPNDGLWLLSVIDDQNKYQQRHLFPPQKQMKSHVSRSLLSFNHKDNIFAKLIHPCLVCFFMQTCLNITSCHVFSHKLGQNVRLHVYQLPFDLRNIHFKCNEERVSSSLYIRRLLEMRTSDFFF